MGGVSATGQVTHGRVGHPDMDKMGLTFFASTTAVEPFSLALETGDLLTVTLGALAALKRVVLLVVLVIEVEAGAAMVAAAGWIFFVPAALPPRHKEFLRAGGGRVGGLLWCSHWPGDLDSDKERVFRKCRITFSPELQTFPGDRLFQGKARPLENNLESTARPSPFPTITKTNGTAHVFFFKWIFSYTRPPLSTRAHPFASLMALTSSLAFLALNELCTLVAAALSSFIS